MARKKTSEDELIEKIEKVNKKMEEINKEPIKKESKIKKVANKVKKTAISKTIPSTNRGVFETVLVLINIALIFCLVGYLIGTKLKLETDSKYTTVDKEIETFIEQYNNILDNYYGEVNKDELITSAINGMLSSLDDYSEVIDSSSNTFNVTLEGEYEGIGVSIGTNTSGEIVIVSIIEDTPAERAGLKAGDIITYFNDVSLSNVPTSDLVSMIASNQKMTLTVIRDGEEMKFDIVREHIDLKSIKSEMLDNKIGYIQVSLFANNTYEQFKSALDDLEKSGMEKLIIDLRGNTGGHLTAAEKMLSLFMNKSHIIYQTEDGNGVDKVYSSGKEDKTYQIVVLQDEASASASEIVAASLKENLSAYIIGKKSFGKGTVQQMQQAGSIQYKFTTKKWLTPNGSWINGVGIIPDLEVSLDENYMAEPTRENDTQFQAAIDYLK